jgi:hypothetical protein
MAGAVRASVRADRVRQVLEDADDYARQRALAATGEAFRAGVQVARSASQGPSWSPAAPEQARRRAAIGSGDAPDPPICSAI